MTEKESNIGSEIEKKIELFADTGKQRDKGRYIDNERDTLTKAVKQRYRDRCRAEKCKDIGFKIDTKIELIDIHLHIHICTLRERERRPESEHKERMR